ncbi:MAG: hypothetical protein OXE77_00685 [Flavobacteriaceae bacterium]|nr:hypothetical protein [Flavobacteriaceae bacterium]MCY4266318.1 hypothetical protein [Flavobacteriaceae bacterium]
MSLPSSDDYFCPKTSEKEILYDDRKSYQWRHWDHKESKTLIPCGIPRMPAG